MGKPTPSPTPSETITADHDARFEDLYAEGDPLIARIRENNKPRVFIISGPSGVGKDSVIEELIKVFPGAQYVVTATTRPKRKNEVEGIHYIFLTEDEFLDRIDRKDFIENDLVYDNHYGVPRSPIVQGLAEGRDVIIKVDVKGAATLRTRIPHTVSIFLTPESMPALRARLEARKTDDLEVLLKRFTTATAELAEVKDFDYVVFNEAGKLEDAVEQICNIVSIEHRKVDQPEINIP